MVSIPLAKKRKTMDTDITPDYQLISTSVLKNYTPVFIPLTLHYKKSILHNIELLELCDPTKMENLVSTLRKNPSLCDANTSLYTSSKTRIFFNSYLHQLKSYGALMDPMNRNTVKVRYTKPLHGWGRVMPVGALGYTAFPKKIRNTLMYGSYFDFDIKMAQYKIIHDVCNHYSINCDYVKVFVRKRDDIIMATMDCYGVNQKQAKQLFIRLGYLGSFSYWKEECGLPMHTNPTRFMKNLQKEIRNISFRLIQNNNELFVHTNKMARLKGKETDERITRSFLSYYIQEHETRIMECVVYFLITNTKIMSYPGNTTYIGTYEYDGIKLLKQNVIEYGGVIKLQKHLKEYVKQTLGFTITFQHKPIETGYCLG